MRSFGQVHIIPDLDGKLLSLKRLLFILETEESKSRAAVYFDSKYRPGVHRKCGYVLELDMNMYYGR